MSGMAEQVTNMEQYDEEIRKLIETCQAHRLDDPQKVIASARNLRRYAKKENDTDLLAHADYYMANAYYVLNDRKSCLHYLNDAIDGFEKVKDYEDLGFSYNVMGLVNMRNGNAAGAISAYLQALKIAEEHHCNMLGAYVQINCADLCMELEDDEEALHYLQLAETYLDRCRDEKRQPFVYVVAASESALIAHNLNDMEELNRQKLLLERLLGDHPEFSDNINVQLLDIVTDDEQDKSKRDGRIRTMWNKLKKEPEFLDYHNEIIRLMNILRESGNDAILDELIERLNNAVEGILPLGMQTSISNFCISYYKEKGREQLYQQELVKYYQSAELLNHQREQSILSLLHASMDLAVSRRTNMILEKAADTDALTDHPNRRAFNAKADLVFDEASEAQTCLGLEMLDIDNFKQINDTYGHTTGDDALIQVARALQKFDSEQIWSARYGGDEFVVLFNQCSDGVIKEYMQHIKEEISILQMQNGLPYFTISQGAVNRIPQPLNRVWDYYYSADAALYQVKKNGKNQSLLIHDISELNDSDIEMVEV